jgi:hypothetical protein
MHAPSLHTRKGVAEPLSSPALSLSCLERLPKELVQSIANVLDLTDVMRFRRTSRIVYAVPFLGHSHVRITSLVPGLVSRIQTQRARVKHLTLSCRVPFVSEATRNAFSELRTLRHLTRLDVIVCYVYCNPAHSEQLEQGTLQLWKEAFPLGLESLSFRSMGNGGMELFDMCLVLNRATLRHVHLEGDLQSKHVHTQEATSVLQELTSLTTNCGIPGVSYLAEHHAVTRQQATNALVHLNLLHIHMAWYDENYPRVDIPNCATLPWYLPDTLRVASLVACRDSVWVCPPHVEFLHVRFTQPMQQLLPRHLPVTSCARLRCLVLDLAYHKRTPANEQLQSFSMWLARARFPELVTLVILQMATFSEVNDVLHMVQNTAIPQACTLYMELVGDRCTEMRDMLVSADIQRLLHNVGIRLFLDALPRNLEADHLCRMRVPCLIPDFDGFWNRSSSTNRNPPWEDIDRIIHLCPGLRLA